MKEKLKKFWESLKKFFNWCAEHEFLSITIVSIVFAFIVHCLFSEYVNEWLSAKWGAGDILTYVSTIFLGALALWQNKRFKEANDKHEEEMQIANRKYEAEISANNEKHEEDLRAANEKMFKELAKDYKDHQKFISLQNQHSQEQMSAQNKEAQDRMAEIVRKTNEIASKSKIIDIESKRINEIEKAITNFDKACFPNEIFRSALLAESKYEKDCNLLELKNKAYNELVNLIRVTSVYLPENCEEIIDKAKSYYESSENVINSLLNNEIVDDNEKLTSKDIEDMKEFELLYKKLKEDKKIFSVICELHISVLGKSYSKLLDSFK